MSEELPPPSPKTAAIPPPSASGPKTSAVPLKKETVRITLRARPGAGVTQPREATAPVPTSTGAVPAPTSRATAPVQLPSAPLPPPSPKATTNPVSLPPAPIPPPGRKTMAVEVAAPTAPMAPSAPRPSAPPAPMAAPAAPRPPVPGAPAAPRPPVAGAPAAPGAPRPPAPGAPAAPRVETGAMTQPMVSAPRAPMAGAPRPPGGGTGTGPLAGGAPTAALPKATQKLQATQPMARPGMAPVPPSAPVKRAQQDAEQFYDEKDPEAGLVPLSAVCLILSIILLLAQMVSSDRVEGLTSAPGEESQMLVPQYEKVAWEERDPETHVVTNKFSSVLPDVPK